MRRQGVVVLGATGSVGRNALDVISRFPRRFRIVALCAGSNAKALASLARRHRPDVVCLSEGDGQSMTGLLPGGTRVLRGEEGMREAACREDADIVLVERVHMWPVVRGRRFSKYPNDNFRGSATSDRRRSIVDLQRVNELSRPARLRCSACQESESTGMTI